MPKEVKSFNTSAISLSNDTSFVPPHSRFTQYFGKDCQALAVTVGGLASNKKLRIYTSKEKLEIWSLTKSDLSCIMAFLSDNAMGRVLEWFQSAGSFSDESVDPWGEVRFKPR
jgi:hypothetical protein